MPPRFRRVLFVAYQFPPVGGVGVHRVTKFIKYLPEFGWESSVLTVANPSVPLFDESLNRDIPPGTLIRRAKTYEPGYGVKQAVAGDTQRTRSPLAWIQKCLRGAVRTCGNILLQPDAQILWHPHAAREGSRLLSDLPHDVIVATGPPFSSLILGAKLAHKSGLPLILDYRDEWDISNAYWENKQQGRLANWIQQRQQARVLKRAKRVLATTPSSAEAIEHTAQRAGSSAVVTSLYNGFDPDDYPHATSPEKENLGHGTDRFRLAFIGTLWNLNSIEPVVRALEQLTASQPNLAGQLELLLAGRRTPDQETLVDRLHETPVALTQLPFLEHSRAVQLMRSADALLMLNADLPQTQRIINAKTYEYMAARRPMFVVAPPGDVWDIVRDLPGTRLCRPADVDAIAENLALAIEEHRCGINHQDAVWDIARFHRRELTRQLADLLDDSLKHSVTSQTSSANQHDPMEH